jgi:hypothetical protein
MRQLIVIMSSGPRRALIFITGSTGKMVGADGAPRRGSNTPPRGRF